MGSGGRLGGGRGRCPCPCSAWLLIFAIVLFVASLALFAVTCVTTNDAITDPRADLVSEYDAAVDVWVGEAASDYKGLRGGSPLPPAALAGSAAPLRPVALATSDAVVFGKLRDDEDDFKTYATGTVLEFGTDQAASYNASLPKELRLTVGSLGSLMIPLKRCNVKSEEECLRLKKNGDCAETEDGYAVYYQYVAEVMLVENENQALEKLENVPCAVQWADVASLERRWFSNSKQAALHCTMLDTGPLQQNIAIQFQLRSHLDPFVKAGGIAGCDLDFGLTAAEHAQAAIGSGVSCFVAFVIGCLLVCQRRKQLRIELTAKQQMHQMQQQQQMQMGAVAYPQQGAYGAGPPGAYPMSHPPGMAPVGPPAYAAQPMPQQYGHPAGYPPVAAYPAQPPMGVSGYQAQPMAGYQQPPPHPGYQFQPPAGYTGYQPANTAPNV